MLTTGYFPFEKRLFLSRKPDFIPFTMYFWQFLANSSFSNMCCRLVNLTPTAMLICRGKKHSFFILSAAVLFSSEAPSTG